MLGYQSRLRFKGARSANMFELHNDESGNIIFSLAMIPCLLIIILSIIGISQDVSSADVILKNSTVIAVEGAASQFISAAEIPPDQAEASFKNMLEQNLKLDDNLNPLSFSAFSTNPNYTLLVFNGSQGGTAYTCQNGQLSSEPITPGNFPQTFQIGSGINVRLNSPGVIATIEETSKSILGRPATYQRWAAAQVVMHNGTPTAALVGAAS